MCMSIIYRQTDHTLQQHSNCTEDMDVSVCIEPGHLFRYKKEVNPKNKKSKVSKYCLKPALQLPGPGKMQNQRMHLSREDT